MPPFGSVSRLQFAFFLIAAVCLALVRRARGRRAPAAWTVWQEALVLTLRRHGQKLVTMSPSAARARSDSLQASDPPPRGLRFTSLRIGGCDALRVVAPKVEAPIDVLYFHGGGYAFGSPASYRGHLGRLARAIGGRVTAPHYALAPEHRFPAAVEDAVAVYAAMVQQVDASRLVVAGDSAGAALALGAVIAARDQRRPLAAGMILLSPWCDLAAETGSAVANSHLDWGDGAYLAHWARLYLGDADARDPRASPLYADLHGLPPLRVLVGGAELVRDQATQLVDAARAAGVDARLESWPHLVHGFWMLGPIFPARAALAQVAAWSKSATGAGVSLPGR